VADLPVELADELGDRLSRSLDAEGKIPRALDALGPIAGRDVLLLDGGERRARQLRELGGRVVEATGSAAIAGLGDRSTDVIVSFWSAFRGAAPSELAEASRLLRPDGRLLIVHDYGRDDVSHLHGPRPEYGPWSKRNGPFLNNGFRVRVVHCFWTFESMDDCTDFLSAAFADAGRAVAGSLKRPRLSYNVAIYHRTFGEAASMGDRVASGAAAPPQFAGDPAPGRFGAAAPPVVTRAAE
jgi:hypothetical protein